MAYLTLDNKDFNEMIKNKVLVDFYATWCGPCKMLSPILENISNKIDFDIIKIDVDEHEDLARKYGIMSIPTLILFDNSRELKKHIGFISEEQLLTFLKD